ncbi:MAG: DUF1819 family protein [Firmicutes bacterium]|nr:DUF1819 family protein [Bacillota bacterium]
MSSFKSLPTMYTAIMTGEPYLYFEFRQVAKMRLAGLGPKEIRQKVYSENIFQYQTNKSIGRVLTAVLRRLDVLDDTLLEMCVNGSLATGRLIAVYTIAKTNLLFFEFLEEVYREKILLGNAPLNREDLRIFFAQKRRQSKRVAGWSDETVVKLSQVYLKILRDAGLITSESPVTAPLVEQPLIDYFTYIGEHRFLTAILGRV